MRPAPASSRQGSSCARDPRQRDDSCARFRIAVELGWPGSDRARSRAGLPAGGGCGCRIEARMHDRAAELLGVRDTFVEPILTLLALELGRPGASGAGADLGMPVGGAGRAPRAAFQHTADEAGCRSSALEPHSLSKVLDYLHTAAEPTVTLTALARVAGVSPFRLRSPVSPKHGEGIDSVSVAHRLGSHNNRTAARFSGAWTCELASQASRAAHARTSGSRREPRGAGKDGVSQPWALLHSIPSDSPG